MESTKQKPPSRAAGSAETWERRKTPEEIVHFRKTALVEKIFPYGCPNPRDFEVRYVHSKQMHKQYPMLYDRRTGARIEKAEDVPEWEPVRTFYAGNEVQDKRSGRIGRVTKTNRRFIFVELGDWQEECLLTQVGYKKHTVHQHLRSALPFVGFEYRFDCIKCGGFWQPGNIVEIPEMPCPNCDHPMRAGWKRKREESAE